MICNDSHTQRTLIAFCRRFRKIRQIPVIGSGGEELLVSDLALGVEDPLSDLAVGCSHMHSLPSCRDTIAADRDLAEHRGECIAHFLKGLLRVEPKEMLLHTSHADNKRHLAGSRIVLHRLHLDIRCVRPECHVNDPLHELRRLLRGHCSVSRQVVACQRDSDSKTDKVLSINSHQITPLLSNRFGIW